MTVYVERYEESKITLKTQIHVFPHNNLDNAHSIHFNHTA